MKLSWWGHATTTIDVDGTRLLTDPVLTYRLAHLRRRRGPVPVPAAGHCDAVLISHLHSDHLHLPSLRLVSPKATFVVPRGAARLISQVCGPSYGERCVEVTAGEKVRINDLDITAVPAHHDGRRHPWAALRAPALGYRVDGSPSVWFAGDTDLFEELNSQIGPVDLALVPVGGWGPNLGPGHLDPVRAAEAVQRVGARAAVPIHFGTFWPVGCDWLRPELFLPPGERFVTAMAELDPQVRVDLLEPGDTTEVLHA
ncbi:MBL fold metallo-hydrolase [Kribbella deserti]|uniref:MBL fold metallo-hydrolase n=1 Tax=Kribbella deserti TaxID=1926257 RepID=A0ABV6QKK1_9ACTN